MNPAAMLHVVVNANTDPAVRALRGVDRQAATSSKRLDALAKSGEKSFTRLKIAAGAAAVGLAVIGKKSIDMASDIAEQTSKIDTVLGSSSKVIQDFAATSAKSFGISRQEALGAGGSFASMFKILGQSSPAAAQMSVQMTKLAADMASFNNKTPTEALTALQAGLRGEMEPLRAFNVLLNDATLRQQALADGMIKSTSQALSPQQKAMAAYGVILKQTGVQQGDFERTSEGLANKQRVLKAEIADMQATLGKALLPTMLKVVQALQKFIEQIKSGEGAGGRFADALQAIYGRVRPIVKFFMDHPQFIGVAVTAWAAYRVAALAALAATRLKLIAQFFGLSTAASAGGAAAGGAWGAAFYKRALPHLAALAAFAGGLKIVKEITGGDLTGGPSYDKSGKKYTNPNVRNAGKLAQGPTTASKIMQYFQSIGYSKQAAAGFVGNFMQESGLRTGAREGGGSGPGFGLAQWSFGRRKQLEAFAKRNNRPSSDLGTQLAFAQKELSGMPGLQAALKRAKTPQEAASLIERQYERPLAGPTANSRGRQNWAAQAFAGTISKINAKKNATKLAQPNFDLPGLGGAGAGGVAGAVKTGLEKFEAAKELITLKLSAGVLSSVQAAEATLKLVEQTLTKKGLSKKTRLTVMAAGREAQKTISGTNRTGLEKFEAAKERLEQELDAGVLSSVQAAEETVRLAQQTLAKKGLSKKTRLTVTGVLKSAREDLERLQKVVQDALEGIRSDLKSRVSAALNDFHDKWEKTIGKDFDKRVSGAFSAFDAQTKAIIADSPAARLLAQLVLQEDAIDAAAKDAANSKALADAKKSGNKAAIAEAQAAIDETARQRAITQAQVAAQAEQDAIQAQRETERLSLEESFQTEREALYARDSSAFEKKLTDQFNAEVLQLQMRKQSYTKFVKDVSKILNTVGLGSFEGSADLENVFRSGSSAVTAKTTDARAVGNFLAAFGSSAPTIGEVNLYNYGTEIDENQMANILAWKIQTAAI